MQQPSPLLIFLKNIWPTAYRIINGFLYYCVHMLQVIVKKSIEQIRGT